MSEDSKKNTKNVLTNQDKSVNTIWKNLERRAEQLGYGSLVCEVQVHQGRIRQVDITTVKERLRAD